jgi:hypothetical protein
MSAACAEPTGPDPNATRAATTLAPAQSTSARPPPVAAPDTADPAAPTPASIAQLLTQVPVAAELPNIPGYQRSCSPGMGCVFGRAWNDPNDHTGCDTRNRVLAAQLTDVVFKPGTNDCKVLSGQLVDPYSGEPLSFVSGAPTDIEIDHVFPLARAWDAGAANWPLDKRIQFANDTDELLAVSGKQNGAKSDSGPGEWLPPNAAFACRYVQIYLTVAAKYQLAVTEADRDAASVACAS